MRGNKAMYALRRTATDRFVTDFNTELGFFLVSLPLAKLFPSISELLMFVSRLGDLQGYIYGGRGSFDIVEVETVPRVVRVVG